MVASKSTTKNTTKNGPRTVREKTPDYSLASLEDSLAQYVKKVGTVVAFNLGVYASVPIGHAVRGRGIVFLSELVEALVRVAGHLTFKHNDLKMAVTNVVLLYPDLHDKKRSLCRFASDLAERLFCLSNHTRRLAHSTVRFSQAIKDLSDHDQSTLKQLVSKVQLKSGTNAVELASSSGSPAAKAPRKLQQNDTVCSIDSDGFPNVLKTVGLPKDSSPPPAGPGSAIVDLVSVAPPSEASGASSNAVVISDAPSSEVAMPEPIASDPADDPNYAAVPPLKTSKKPAAADAKAKPLPKPSAKPKAVMKSLLKRRIRKLAPKRGPNGKGCSKCRYSECGCARCRAWDAEDIE